MLVLSKRSHGFAHEGITEAGDILGQACCLAPEVYSSFPGVLDAFGLEVELDGCIRQQSIPLLADIEEPVPYVIEDI